MVGSGVCCFCNKAIKNRVYSIGIRELKFGKVIVGGDRSSGMWFCHISCFRKALHPEMKRVHNYVRNHKD